ncbi:hypothetical protein [Streptomyces sp. NPDC003697]
MTFTRPKVALVTGVVLVLTLVAGMAYAFELPPFEKKGEVEAANVCDSLGDASHAAAALRDVLPEKSSYSFEDSATDLRTDELDHSYETGCFVRGGGEQLLVARTEMLEYDKADNWVTEVVGQFDVASSLEPFGAGDKAVASGKVAAIYLPCASHGANRHLSVVVQLKKQGDAPSSVLRSRLAALAKNAAAFAHRKARCDVPPRLHG